MRKKAVSWILTMAMVLSLFAALPITANAQPPYTCMIVETDTEHLTLDSALEAVTTGQTIRLLQSLTYNSGIVIDGKNITFDLNSYVLDVKNASSGGKGLEVKNGAVFINGTGALNVSGNSYGVYATGKGTSVEVTSASATNKDSNGAAAYASSGAHINVQGSLAGIVVGAGAYGTDSQIKAGGDCTCTAWVGYGAQATNGAKIIIDGDITATGPESYGVKVNANSFVTVGGNVQGGIYGLYAEHSGQSPQVRIVGNCTAMETGSYGVYAEDGADISIDSNIQGTAYGIYAANSTTAPMSISVGGDCTSTGTTGTGIYANGGMQITVDGQILSPGTYIKLKSEVKGINDFTIPTTKTGYRTYTDNADPPGIVWVKAPLLTPGAVNRSSENDATVKFTSNKPGSYYFEVVSDGASPPVIDTSGAGTACDTSEQTISLSTLSAGAKEIYIIIKDAAGNLSSPLVIDIPAYVNQVPVITSSWAYDTIYYGQEYPYTVTITDLENTAGTVLYQYLDSAVPLPFHTFSGPPGTINVSLAIAPGGVSPGNHTVNFYAVNASGATSAVLSLPFTLTNAPSSNANLSALSLSNIVLTPAFSSNVTAYTASVANSISSTTISAEPADAKATVTINGMVAKTKLIALTEGSNTLTIKVTAEDQVTVKTYTITVNRAGSSNSSSGSSGGSYTPPPNILVTTEQNRGFTANTTTINPLTSGGISSADIGADVVQALLNKAALTGGTDKGDVLGISINTPDQINQLNMSIPLARIASDTAASLAISSSFISITFDSKAIDTIAGTDSGGIVDISVKIIDNNTLSAAEQARVQNRPVYSFTVMNGNKHISDFGGGYAKVSIPYTLQPGENPNAVVVYYLAADGSLQTVRGHYDTTAGAVVFKTNHLSKFVIAYNQLTFTDVAADAWYKNAVDFMAARGITSGTGNHQFAPEGRLTRGQFVVLLMNAYQITMQNQGKLNQIQNFSDAGNTYYTDYLLAAKGLRIVNGIGDNLFAPEKEITRQEMLVMLYNALKVIDEVPAANLDKSLSAFDDAGQVAEWAKPAVEALVNAGIVDGYNNNLYPTSGTTRAEITQVLYNLLLK